jgi:hypothetical protein
MALIGGATGWDCSIASPTTVQKYCPFEIGLCSAKEGGMAVPAVRRLVYYLLVGFPFGAMGHAKANRRDALCSSPQVQKQAAFGVKVLSL